MGKRENPRIHELMKLLPSWAIGTQSHWELSERLCGSCLTVNLLRREEAQFVSSTSSLSD
jgi:hypothetical protein